MTSESSSFSSNIATQILLALTSLIIGFNIGLRSSDPKSSLEIQPEPVSGDEAQASKEDADVEAEMDGDLAAIQAKNWEPCKLILVVRTDLKMNPGDISMQCSDATLACYKVLSSKNPQLVRHWEITGQAKIALKGTSDDQLLELEAIAKSLNLCARAVHNSELTEGKEGTRTVLGIGPAPVELVNQVTGKLRLL